MAESILVWYRVGPIDFDGPNYFKIRLWTPFEFTTLVKDTSDYNFWEDLDIPYEAYLLHDGKVVYRKEDSLYVYNLLTQEIDKKLIVPGINKVYEFLNHILVFAYPAPPELYDINLTAVGTWNRNQQHPVSAFESMALDSFLVGIHTGNYVGVHAVNGFTEESIDLDLSTALVAPAASIFNEIFTWEIMGRKKIVIKAKFYRNISRIDN